MGPDLRYPLLGDVVEWRGVDHAEAQEEDVCVGVGQSPEFIKLFLCGTWTWQVISIKICADMRHWVIKVRGKDRQLTFRVTESHRGLGKDVIEIIQYDAKVLGNPNLVLLVMRQFFISLLNWNIKRKYSNIRGIISFTIQKLISVNPKLICSQNQNDSTSKHQCLVLTDLTLFKETLLYRYLQWYKSRLQVSVFNDWNWKTSIKCLMKQQD